MKSFLFLVKQKLTKLTSQRLTRTYSIDKTIKFINRQRLNHFIFRYASSQKRATLYSSCYAVMILSLLNKLKGLSAKKRNDWGEYILSFQDKDGLFKDPAIASKLAETEDWWGWRHLTCHAIIALIALEVKVTKPFKLLEFLYEKGKVKEWLKNQDWQTKPDFVSNTILNYGTLLQYSRDFHQDKKAGRAMEEMYSWLDKNQDVKTGLWGPRPKGRQSLSKGAQTAYHLWLLYFYDQKPIHYIEKCVDSCLQTQNRAGGFGVKINSNACEDIDSIDPLVRFYFLTSYRRLEIEKALVKAYQWVLKNMNEDGGFVFERDKPFQYGHKLMSSKANESAMFPTWFRVLSLAYLSQVIDDPSLAKIDWNFIDCPGYQFWRV